MSLKCCWKCFLECFSDSHRYCAKISDKMVTSDSWFIHFFSFGVWSLSKFFPLFYLRTYIIHVQLLVDFSQEKIIILDFLVLYVTFINIHCEYYVLTYNGCDVCNESIFVSFSLIQTLTNDTGGYPVSVKSKI